VFRVKELFIMDKNTKKVVDLLNQGRARELAAILQYMAQHYELENQDFGKLAKFFKKTAIVEMKHAEAFGERILFLGGVPTSKPDMEAKKGESIAAMLATGMKLEAEAIAMYNASALACAEAGDLVSKALFEKILGEENTHFDDFRQTKDHVDLLGDVYLATQTGAGE
jgi:bacterioferritin